MPVDLQMLIGVVVGIIALFGIVIVFGLRFSSHRQAGALRDSRGTDVLAAMGMSRTELPALLYGLWQTTMAEVILHVRDGNDTEVARITHRIRGARITVGDEHYNIVITSGRRESAALMHDGSGTPGSSPLCTFQLRGWGGRQIARYTLPDKSSYSIRTHWSLSWKSRPLPILQGDQVTGQLFAIGGAASNAGRAVVLPPTIPLPIRLFVLYKAVGSRPVASGGR